MELAHTSIRESDLNSGQFCRTYLVGNVVCLTGIPQTIISDFAGILRMVTVRDFNVPEFGESIGEFGVGIYELCKLEIHDGAETQQSAFRFDVNGGPKWKSGVIEKRKVWQINKAHVVSNKSEVKANDQIEHKQQGHRVCHACSKNRCLRVKKKNDERRETSRLAV